MNNQVLNNLNLVKYVIKKMNIFDKKDYDDYYQVGVIGLINAVNNYDNNLKITFSTYAYVCIKNEILKYLKKNTNNYISLEKEIFDDITIEETIKTNDEEIIETIILKETNKKIYDIINNELNEIETKIIKMSFGLGNKQYKQTEIEKILNIPQYKISRIKNRTLRKIRDLIEITD